jgi:hypothetical protein
MLASMDKDFICRMCFVLAVANRKRTTDRLSFYKLWAGTYYGNDSEVVGL